MLLIFLDRFFILCIYHLLAELNSNLLHNSHSITFPIQSYLFFCFISVTIQPTFAILLRIIKFCFSSYGILLLFFKRIQFLFGFPFLAKFQ